MPISNPIVLKSIWLIACSCDRMPAKIISIAPTIPTTVRCIFSEIINIYAMTKIATAMYAAFSIKITSFPLKFLLFSLNVLKGSVEKTTKPF